MARHGDLKKNKAIIRKTLDDYFIGKGIWMQYSELVYKVMEDYEAETGDKISESSVRIFLESGKIEDLVVDRTVRPFKARLVYPNELGSEKPTVNGETKVAVLDETALLQIEQIRFTKSAAGVTRGFTVEFANKNAYRVAEVGGKLKLSAKPHAIDEDDFVAVDVKEDRPVFSAGFIKEAELVMKLSRELVKLGVLPLKR